jgi:death-on-curing protein
MIKITKSEIIDLHNILLKYSGGASGLRDEGLLESALAAPFAEYDGIELFDTLERKAAKLCFSLVKNHCFVDGINA